MLTTHALPFAQRRPQLLASVSKDGTVRRGALWVLLQQSAHLARAAFADSRLEREDRDVRGLAGFAYGHLGGVSGTAAVYAPSTSTVAHVVLHRRTGLLSSLAQAAARFWNGSCRSRCVPMSCLQARGDLRLFAGAQALAAGTTVAATAAAPSSDATAFPASPAGHGSRVDSLVALAGGRVASKSGDGRVIVWDVATKAQAAAFRVPGCTPGSARGRLGSNPDGSVLLAGGAAGELHAFDSATGSKLATLTTGKVWLLASLLHMHGADAARHAQVRAPVLACAATGDCSTVLGVVGPGWIARWETIVAGAAVEAADDGDD